MRLTHEAGRHLAHQLEVRRRGRRQPSLLMASPIGSAPIPAQHGHDRRVQQRRLPDPRDERTAAGADGLKPRFQRAEVLRVFRGYRGADADPRA
jgi:hypothetical protein